MGLGRAKVEKTASESSRLSVPPKKKGQNRKKGDAAGASLKDRQKSKERQGKELMGQRGEERQEVPECVGLLGKNL